MELTPETLNFTDTTSALKSSIFDSIKFKILKTNLTASNITHEDDEKKVNDIKLLRPFLYTNKLKDAVALNSVVLSPSAFVTSILKPKFLKVCFIYKKINKNILVFFQI